MKTYTYKGRRYEIDLNQAEKFECDCDDMEIEKDTVAEVEAEIRRQVDAEKNVAQTTVLTFGETRWGQNNYLTYREGKARPINVGSMRSPYYWVSWRDSKGRPERAKLDAAIVYADTPSNRSLMNGAVKLGQEIETLERKQKELIEGLEALKEIKQ